MPFVDNRVVNPSRFHDKNIKCRRRRIQIYLKKHFCNLKLMEDGKLFFIEIISICFSFPCFSMFMLVRHQQENQFGSDVWSFTKAQITFWLLSSVNSNNVLKIIWKICCTGKVFHVCLKQIFFPALIREQEKWNFSFFLENAMKLFWNYILIPSLQWDEVYVVFK